MKILIAEDDAVSRLRLETTLKKWGHETVTAMAGTTLNVPPGVWHQVRSEGGARLLTIFSPGGFDRYLDELVALTEGQYADAAFMKRLSERYDIFEE